MTLKDIVRPAIDNALGDRLRAFTGMRQPDPMRPTDARASVSDLFPWRQDDIWETRFELLNMPSLAVPGSAAPDRSTIVLFDTAGSELHRIRVDIEPFGHRQIEFSDHPATTLGAGCFACFHDSPALAPLTEQGSWLAERGYLAFRRKNDPLWSYVHGNAHALALRNGDGRPAPIAARSRSPRLYRPQVRFDDCTAFELIYVNALKTPAQLTLRLMDQTRRVLETRQYLVAPRGTEIIAVENVERRIVTVEGEGPRPAWRPIIFKHYDTHFDVFHG